MERILFTKAEVAEATKLSVRTIERMIKRKELTAVRPSGPGGHLRIPLAEVKRLAGEGAIGAFGERL